MKLTTIVSMVGVGVITLARVKVNKALKARRRKVDLLLRPEQSSPDVTQHA